MISIPSNQARRGGRAAHAESARRQKRVQRRRHPRADRVGAGRGARMPRCAWSCSTAAGSVFSAGADANWMAKMIGYSREDNLADAGRMADMFFALDTLPAAVVGRIHGAALGGGAGLVAICDIAVAEEATVFGFTETKLGILPAVISPYVLPKIGPSAARELFLTGMRFPAVRAKEIGLVHAVVPAAELDARCSATSTNCSARRRLALRPRSDSSRRSGAAHLPTQKPSRRKRSRRSASRPKARTDYGRFSTSARRAGRRHDDPSAADRQPRRDRGPHHSRLPRARHRNRRGLFRRRRAGAARAGGRRGRTPRRSIAGRQLSQRRTFVERRARASGRRDSSGLRVPVRTRRTLPAPVATPASCSSGRRPRPSSAWVRRSARAS